MTNQNNNQNKHKQTHKTKSTDHKRPFLEHVYEIRRRLFYIFGSILIFSTLAYFVQQRIVHFLLKPAHSQQFIYTSPGGGITFLFTICTYVGIIVSLPIILYQIMRFLEPVISTHTNRLILKASIVSFILATAGFMFGYIVGLPTALHFLGDQFNTKQIHALFTIQEYMSFLTIYLGGSALLFQLPLLVWFIDKIKPRGPKQFLHYERHVIAGSFIIAMLMAPVPNLIYQSLIALPIIAMYQLAIIIVWYEHRAGGRMSIEQLRQQDALRRQQYYQQPQPTQQPQPAKMVIPVTAIESKPQRPLVALPQRKPVLMHRNRIDQFVIVR